MFTTQTDPKPGNNLFIFSPLSITFIMLNQIAGFVTVPSRKKSSNCNGHYVPSFMQELETFIHTFISAAL